MPSQLLGFTLQNASLAHIVRVRLCLTVAAAGKSFCFEPQVTFVRTALDYNNMDRLIQRLAIVQIYFVNE